MRNGSAPAGSAASDEPFFKPWRIVNRLFGCGCRMIVTVVGDDALTAPAEVPEDCPDCARSGRGVADRQKRRRRSR
jgi:hypothetical protein